MFTMLTLILPWAANGAYRDLTELNRYGRISLEESAFCLKDISVPTLDLLKSLLRLDPDERPSA